ncbi:hypothetical protein HORM4_1240008 [Vibrio harveyi]|nr:hypothetical protein HORM4_1240008 [Vibrio harveyi]
MAVNPIVKKLPAKPSATLSSVDIIIFPIVRLTAHHTSITCYTILTKLIFHFWFDKRD